MDTFDVRKFITEAKLSEQKKAYIEYEDGSTEHRQFHNSVSDEKIKKMFAPGTDMDGKIVLKVLVGDGLKPMREEKDVIEPEDVPEKDNKEDTDDIQKYIEEDNLEDFSKVKKEVESLLTKYIKNNISIFDKGNIDKKSFSDSVRTVLKADDVMLKDLVMDDNMPKKGSDLNDLSNIMPAYWSFISQIESTYFNKHVLLGGSNSDSPRETFFDIGLILDPNDYFSYFGSEKGANARVKRVEDVKNNSLKDKYTYSDSDLKVVKK